jgi:phosphonate transport system substrate-binding protein
MTAPSATRWRSSPIRARASRRSRIFAASRWPSPPRRPTRASRRRRRSSSAEFGMTPGEDFEPSSRARMTTRSSALPTRTTCPAAAIANSVLGRMIERDVVSEDQIVSIYTVADLPDDRLRHGLQPDARAAGGDPGGVLQLRLGRHGAGRGIRQRNGESQFIPITFQENWAVIRTIDEFNGVEYDCN